MAGLPDLSGLGPGPKQLTDGHLNRNVLVAQAQQAMKLGSRWLAQCIDALEDASHNLAGLRKRGSLRHQT